LKNGPAKGPFFKFIVFYLKIDNEGSKPYISLKYYYQRGKYILKIGFHESEMPNAEFNMLKN